MKLKGFNKRLHNIFFHIHTVSGITISFALFVIFLAGAFSLFRDEVYRWESPDSRYATPKEFSLQKAYDLATAKVPDWQVKNDMTIKLPLEDHPDFRVHGYVYDADSTLKIKSVLLRSDNYDLTVYDEINVHMMETIYHLHYFGQVPFGLYISGLVSLFFLFAIISGLLTHWKDMFSKFFTIRRNGLKNFWKDAHTSLGFISLPFQVIYAITGCLFGLSILLLAPSVLVLFNGSQDEVRATLDPFFDTKYNPDAKDSDDMISLDVLYQKALALNPNCTSHFARIRNYGTEEAAVSYFLDNNSGVAGNGSIIFDLRSGDVIGHEKPSNKGYLASYSVLFRMHFASYGGVYLKIVYFILSIITCFMLIAGILLWQSARDNKKYTDQQRRFHHRVTKAFLCICYSLLPAIAIIFITNICTPFAMENRVFFVDTVFFVSWLILGLSGIFYTDYKRLLFFYVALTGIFAVLIPLANGIMTGDWLHLALSRSEWHVGLVDLAWLITGIFLIYLSYRNQRYLLPSRTIKP